MVEMVSEKTTKLLLEEIENQNKSILEKYSYLIEEFEELMRRVRPKMIVITNQFTDIANFLGHLKRSMRIVEFRCSIKLLNSTWIPLSLMVRQS
jgi:Holliday junction resolvasome RuvABC endonuclease subunit